MLGADPGKVSARAKKRGLPQMGTLGAGNHYAEVQVVEEVHDPAAARKMGIDEVGQVVVMIHSGSRGLGHQVRLIVPRHVLRTNAPGRGEKKKHSPGRVGAPRVCVSSRPPNHLPPLPDPLQTNPLQT